MNLTTEFYNLGESFYSPHIPEKKKHPTLCAVNTEVLQSFDITLNKEQLIKIFSGNEIFPHSPSYALVYAGHQFGSFNPKLGDGRAVNLGNIKNTKNELFEIGLKGSGVTPYSRRGDGLLAIGPAVREYIISEYFRALGIPTTYCAAMTISEDIVMREQPFIAAVLTRIGRSFMRVGTFEYFLNIGNYHAIQTLADYLITYYYKDVAKGDYLQLFTKICTRQACLIAQWQSIGFIHGVMNTDNMSIVGETIDYGPCAFMDEFSYAKVFSSIDKLGRYAFKNQIHVGIWNLTSLANCFITLFEDKSKMVPIFERTLHESLETYNKEYYNLMSKKLAIKTNKKAVDELLTAMELYNVDYTNLFVELAHTDIDKLCSKYAHKVKLYDWLQQWKHLRISNYQQKMTQINPYVIPRNHIVEQVIAQANMAEFTPFYDLLQILHSPFSAMHISNAYTKTPNTFEKVTQTFCGT